MHSLKLAVIGAGGRMCRMLGGMCPRGVEVAAVADPQADAARQRLTAAGIDPRGTHFIDDARLLVADADRFDGFAIGTRCYLHAPLAIEVAQARKPLFLEKPVAIDSAQLDALAAAWRGFEHLVLVSLPLRVTPLFSVVREVMASGRLGVINQVQAVNNARNGDTYFDSWYRRFDQVGGLWLQKATHDFDYLNTLIGARPLRIAAMMTQRIFGTGRALQPQRSAATAAAIDAAERGPAEEDLADRTATLADTGSRFHAAIRNQDAGSAIIWYDNGVIASYDQNFASRNAAGTRGAIVTGFDGTLQWDWTAPEHARIVDHHSQRVDDIRIASSAGHSGGDASLQQTFVDMMRGGPNTGANLKDGLLSVAMCLAARKAAQHHTVESIPDFDIYPPAPGAPDPMAIEAL